MTFDIVIPTYKRKDKLIRLLKSIPDKKEYKVFVYFDNQDIETYYEIDKLLPDIYYKYVCPYKFQAFGIWNHHLQNNFYSDIFVYICDDAELFPDTLENVEKHFVEKFPDTDGIVTFKQANIQGTDSAMGCVGYKFAQRYPRWQVFNPNYISFFADTDLGDYAKKLGRFYYGEDCLINHYHPGAYKEEVDETHKIIRGQDKVIDAKINRIRKEKGLLYPINLEMIDRTPYEGL